LSGFFQNVSNNPKTYIKKTDEFRRSLKIISRYYKEVMPPDEHA